MQRSDGVEDPGGVLWLAANGRIHDDTFGAGTALRMGVGALALACGGRIRVYVERVA